MSRARLTQIMNLAPDVQEAILHLSLWSGGGGGAR